MLQRAASNAYSWWWASHVRTKQSKWLEQNLQDMGEKVEAVLKLIEEDGDSFIKKAEMYYKKRPEFINFVEESYRAYRSLAERYDILSKELQNANKTLASAFPDQYQFQIDDDDDEDGPPRMPKKLPENPNIPEAPANFPTKKIKAYIALTAKPKNSTKKGTTKPVANVQKSGLTKSEAIQEVDKLQKQILTLQTEKEFAKSSYESGHANYWKLEEQIEVMQEKISKLQDEFEINQVIEDDEARTLMARSALKSCQETLVQLQEKQEKAAAEAKAERERIKAARQKLMSLKGDNLVETYAIGDSINEEDNLAASFDEESNGLKGSKELEKLQDKIKEHFDVGSTTTLTVSQMAEKVDELVSKVINLETAVSSQTALIHRLRSETDDLQSQLKSLEDDNANLIDGKNTVDDKLREMKNKLRELRDLDCSFESQNTSLETHFSEARSNIDTISEKLHNIRPDEEVEELSMFHETAGLTETDVKKEVVGDMKGNDMSTLVLSQDKERDDEKVAQLEHSTAPLRIDDRQLDEQPITIRHKSSSSTLDIAHENRPSTFDAVCPQELLKEYNPSILNVSQPRGPPSELKPNTVFVTQPQEHPTEHNPSNFGAAQPQEEDDRRDKGRVSSNEAEPPNEYKPSTSDVAGQQEPPKGLEPSTLDVAQPKVHPVGHNPSTIDVVRPQDVDKRDVEVVSSIETQPRQHPEEYKLSNFDLPEQELPERLKSSLLDVAQPQEFPMDENPNTLYDVAQQQDVNDRDMEHVMSDETPRQKPASLSASYNQEAQKRETENMTEDNKLTFSSSTKPQEQTRKEEDEPDWQQLFMNGLEGKEKVLLAEYTSTLRNYKTAKKKLGEMEKKTQADFSEIAAQLQDLRSSNANKDEEIRSLQQKLNIVQKTMEEYSTSIEFKDVERPTRDEEPPLPLDNEDIQVIAEDEEVSPVEQKLRADIDAVLEENLDFWMRVSASFSQVQKFQREVEDLHSEIAKLEMEHEKKVGSPSDHAKSHMNSSMKSDIKPLYKHLREIQTSLTVWLDNSEKLKDELHCRFTELCNIQEEINQALNVGAEDEEMKFTSYEAAKFQGEVANMQQENHKVDDELQAGMDHITGLQLEIEHTLTRLNEVLGLGVKSQSENEMKSRSNAKVPLRSFIFGDKQPKKKHSFFSLMHPIKHRKFQHLKSDKLP